MKYNLIKIVFPALLALVLFSCGKPSGENQTTGTTTDSTDIKKILYDQVMEIHDDVMPKMDDIEAMKRKLKEQIANSPNMVDEERKKLERRIVNLDSVGEMMWDWMHRWEPVADSLTIDQARDYLESEMEKIKRVREAMLAIIEEEKKKGN